MEYNSISVKRANKIAEKVLEKNFSNKKEMESWLIENDYPMSDWAIAEATLKYGKEILPFEEKEFYRIGEPVFDYAEENYRGSWNFAEDRREDGISVVTEDWLHSIKSTFFGIDNDSLKAKGIYKIKGFVIGFGGDDEPVIIATAFAEKMKIYSKKSLEKLVK
ncbi:MAG: hypothetical protein WCS30_13025 [Selenomonadaceae bacterium]